MSSSELSASAQRVQDALHECGVDLHIVELDSSTRTAADAASSIGCAVGQIAKSLIFQGQESNHPYLIMVSGINQVSVPAVVSIIGETLLKANADFVRKHTGFAIGGVPPIGHNSRLQTYIDRDLLQYQQVWAAAGTPNAVFSLTPGQLIAITNGKVITVN